MPAKRKDTAKSNASRKRLRQMEFIEEAERSFSWITLFRTSMAIRLLSISVGAVLVIGLDVLVSGNDFDRFALIMGMELLLLTIVIWCIRYFKERKQDRQI